MFCTVRSTIFTLSILLMLLGSSASAQHPIDIQRKTASGQYLDALTLYEKIPRRQVTTDATIAAGKAAWALSLPDSAIEEFEKALQDKNLTASGRARLLLSRGIIEYQEDRFQIAVLYAEKAIAALQKESPLQSKAWLLWGESLVKLNSFGSAEDKYKKALVASAPEDLPEVHYLLGVCQAKLGKNSEARENFEKVPLQHERTPLAIRYLAGLSLEEGKFKEASFWLKKGRDDYPDSFLDSWVDYAMLRVAMETRDVRTAKTIQENAQKKYPPSDQWLTLLNAAAESFAWEAKDNLSEVH